MKPMAVEARDNLMRLVQDYPVELQIKMQDWWDRWIWRCGASSVIDRMALEIAKPAQRDALRHHVRHSTVRTVMNSMSQPDFLWEQTWEDPASGDERLQVELLFVSRVPRKP